LAFLTLTFGMLDLGRGVFRYHILSNAARQAARRAIVHGDKATVLGTWGKATVNCTADDTGQAIVGSEEDGIQPMLVGCDLANTHITLQWIDGSNSAGSRLRATITSPYEPVMTFMLFPITLQASSTMQIAH
jgi:hypothetical protein